VSALPSGDVEAIRPEMTPLPFRLLGLRRLCGLVGLVVTVVGAASVTKPDGVLFVVVGVGLLALYGWMRAAASRARLRDIDAARQLAGRFQAGQWLVPIPPVVLAAVGIQLEAGENCFIDGADVEVLQWYGDPVVLTRRFFFVWGSPLAWMVSILAMFGFWQHNRKKAKKAAPRWREPERAQLWVTDRRFLLHGRTGNQSWVQIRWPSIRQSSLDKDGVVLLLDEHEHRPMKIRTRAPAWLFVLYRFASTHQVFLPRSPWWHRAQAAGGPRPLGP